MKPLLLIPCSLASLKELSEKQTHLGKKRHPTNALVAQGFQDVVKDLELDLLRLMLQVCQNRGDNFRDWIISFLTGIAGSQREKPLERLLQMQFKALQLQFVQE
jgi:hypothetical protein